MPFVKVAKMRYFGPPPLYMFTYSLMRVNLLIPGHPGRKPVFGQKVSKERADRPDSRPEDAFALLEVKDAKSCVRLRQERRRAKRSLRHEKLALRRALR